MPDSNIKLILYGAPGSRRGTFMKQLVNWLSNQDNLTHEVVDDYELEITFEERKTT